MATTDARERDGGGQAPADGSTGSGRRRGSETPSLLQVLRRPLADAASVESVGVVSGAIVFVVGGVVTLLAAGGRDLPIGGPGSLGAIVAIGGAIVASVIFVFVGVLLGAHDGRLDDSGRSRRLRLHPLDTAALALAHAIIALLAWLAVVDVVARSFVDAVVFPFSAAILAAAAMAVTAYAVFLSAAHITATSLSLVLAIFLVLGVFASTLTASDPHWWKHNLSALGVTGDFSALAFNLTLITAGVIVTTIASAGTAALPTRTPAEHRGRSSVRWSLVAIGVLLACVGVLPVDRFFWLHTGAAVGMLVVFAVLAVRLGRLVPAMPRVFLLLGDVFVGGVVLLAVLYAVGHYNLTAVELVAAAMVFSWIILFLRNAGAISAATMPTPALPASVRPVHAERIAAESPQDRTMAEVPVDGPTFMPPAE